MGTIGGGGERRREMGKQKKGGGGRDGVHGPVLRSLTACLFSGSDVLLVN